MKDLQKYELLKELTQDIRFIRDKYDLAFKNIDEKSKGYIEQISLLNLRFTDELKELKEKGFSEIQEALKVLQNGAEYKYDRAPLKTDNAHKKGALWVDFSTGLSYMCVDDSKDNNKWVLQRDFTFNQESPPANAKLNNTWFDTKKGVVFVCEKNPLIAFYRKDFPLSANLGDILFKNKSEDIKDNLFYEGDFYEYKEVEASFAFVEPHLQRANYTGEDEPLNAKKGELWDKNGDLLVYALSEGALKWVATSLSIEQNEAKFKQEIEPEDAEVGDFWYNTDTNKLLVYIKVDDKKSFVKIEKPHEPFIWVNFLQKDLNQKITNTNLELESAKKDFNINLSKAKENLNQSLSETDEKLSNDLKQLKLELTQKIESVNYKCKFDYVDVTPNSVIDFSLSNVFFFNAHTAANKVLHIGAVPDNKRFSCGIICIYGCEFLKGFDGRFKFRIAQSGFAGSEIFSYWIHDINWIRLVRS